MMRLAQARGAAAEFVRWWLAELADMVPPPLRRLLSRQRPAIVFHADGATVGALRLAGGAAQPLGAWDGAGDAAAWAQGVVARAGRARIGWRLAPQAVLRRRVTFPDAVLEDLRGAVGYEMDRLTPYRAEDVVYDARAVGRDRAARTCMVEVVAVPRAELDRAAALAARLQVTPAFVDAPSRLDAPRAGRDLRPRAADAGGDRWAAAGRALALGAAVLAVAALVVPEIRLRAEADRAAIAMEAARANAAHAARLRGEIEAIVAARTALEAGGRGAASPLAVLHALTALLTDDGFLTAWELGQGRVQVAGYAASATAVLTAIEASPLFEETAFRAAVVQSPQHGREAFRIGANLSPAVAP